MSALFVSLLDKAPGTLVGGKMGVVVKCPKCGLGAGKGKPVLRSKDGPADVYVHSLSFALNKRNEPEMTLGSQCVVYRERLK